MLFTDSKQIKAIFEDQGKNRWAIANTTANVRIAKLKMLRKALLARKEEFYEAIWKDFHKSAFEAWLTELFPTIEELDYTVSHLKSWMEDKKAPWVYFLPTTKSRAHFEPKGRVVIFSPWNYPLMLCIAPIISAVAAGNVVIAKPSNKTHHVSAFLSSLIEEVFPQNEVAIIEGEGTSIGNELMELPFDHVFFTGSQDVGRRIAEQSQKHHAGITLELGGKSPVVVLQDANLKEAAEKIAWGKFLNAGQTCIAPDYILCPSNLVEPLANELARKTMKMYGNSEEEWIQCNDFPRIIDNKSALRLQGLIADAENKGAEIALGGKCNIDERYISPTILKNVSEQMRIMESEIFGPVLPIVAYNTLDEAINFIQSKSKPLSLYIFGKKSGFINKILSNTTSGSVCINNCIIQIENLAMPFGGVGHSGTGNYHGFYGFKAFSHERNIMRQNKFDIIKGFHAPYGKTWIQKFLKNALGKIKGM